MTKKKWLLGLILLFTIQTVLTACGESSEGSASKESDQGDFVKDLQLGTGSTGGTYYPLGTEMSTILNKNVDEKDFNVSAVSTGASVDNISRIGRGELQLGMTVHIPAQNAQAGKGEFDGIKVENFGFMGQIYPEIMQVITLESTGVESIADLKGKKVAIGPPGSGTQAAAKAILAAHGLKDGDYKAYEEGFGDAKKKLQDGQIDATFGFLGLPASSINELHAQTKDVKFLEIKGDALKKIQENTKYKPLEISADSYEWLEKPAHTITAYAILVGSTDQVSKELGYKITKALYEHADEISHSQAKYISKENALKGSEDLKMHPGAKKYFKEIGLLK
ncbi:TAXI family TRAP transporter solute-binding subunit [Pontibacillus sp. HMF3514]|uniref:TAXI family TRAP transporter solute-binding subunit n=1 Tax=Pontibacillus sp. HMF3514 TaxID=2692425 RepID=UPI00131FB923|nr:TAXI family TRAP transporter solute-binding subunit [Pontibacillus sp. HMF3514]QHE52802.1 TAXI family TRAP transporter solute-binding subunit [Pontibacillus sp. HMF3514]